MTTTSVVALHAQAPSAAKSPTQVYMDYQAALPKAKSVDDIKMYLSASQVKQIEATPAADRPKMFDLIQMMSSMNTDLKVTKEERTAAGATLTVTAKGGDGKPQKGAVKMVREGGSWKLDGEQWGN